MVMWMKATEVAASSASQVGGMLSTYPRNRVSVCFPAEAVFSPFWVALSADDSGSPASLEAAVPGAFGDATANGRQILPVRSTFQVQIEAFDVTIVAASKKTLKLLRRDGDGFKLQARRVHLSAEVAR